MANVRLQRLGAGFSFCRQTLNDDYCETMMVSLFCWGHRERIELEEDEKEEEGYLS